MLSSSDEWLESIQFAFNKPLDIDSVIWAKGQLRLLEVRGHYANRIAVFEEFFPEDNYQPLTTN